MLEIALPQPAILGKLSEQLARQEPAYRAAQEASDEQNIYPRMLDDGRQSSRRKSRAPSLSTALMPGKQGPIS